MVMECKVTARKSHYPKDVPFDVPEGWVWCKIGDIADVARGGSPRPIDSYLTDDSSGVNWIKIGDAEQGGKYINSTRQRIKIEGVSRSRFVHSGDFLLTNSMSFGRPYILNVDGCIHDGWLVISPINNALYKDFFYYLLSSDYAYQQFSEQASGAVVSNLNKDKVADALIPLPSVSEQKRIVDAVEKWLSILDLIDDGQSKLYELADDAKEKVLNLAIHGKLVPQDPSDEPAIELLKRINPDFKASDNLHYEGILPSGWTLCCLEDVLDYEQPQAYIVNSTDYSDDYKTPVLTPGKSFVLGYTNELSGICNHLPVIIFDDFTTESKYVDFPFKVKSSAMKILRARGEINLKYVAIFMSITRLVGDTHKRYWISEYSKIPIPIPPLREQGRIVLAAKHLLNQLDNLIACISDN